MKRLLGLLALLLVAATITDQLDADFTGTTTNTNITNNSIQLALNGANYHSSGTYTSDVKDLGSNPSGSISWTYNSPSSTSILVSTRSGPTSTPDSSWSAWSSSYNTPSGSTLASPTNRYWQYRTTLSTTDTTKTPVVNSVSITYTENGPSISADTANNDNLDEEHSGAYDMHAHINDTVTITTREGRYRIGSDSYSGWAALTQNSGTSWYLSVPEPSGGWTTREGDLLSVQIRATNNKSISTNQTLSDLIDTVNNAPSINGVSDQDALEGEELTVTFTASDPDGDTLSYSTTHGTITKITNTEADLKWTPTSTDVGTTTVTVTVSDASASDQTSFVVNTTGVNKPPTITDVSDQSVYYGSNVTWKIVVEDENENENLTYSSTPPLSWTQTNSSGYEATAQLIAFDNYKGTTAFTFRVQDDDGASDSTQANLTVNYCGDNTCQSQENAETCSEDCAKKSSPSYLAIDFPDRICQNQTTNISVYNASSRYTCFYQGKTINSAAYCDALAGAEVQIYQLNNTRRIDHGAITSDEQGNAGYTAPQSGRYVARATKEGLVAAEETFTVKTCDQDIDNNGNLIEYERPSVHADPRPTPPPRTERPEITPEEASLLSIFLFYILVPLLTAGLVYLSTEYYQEYKDTDPRLLAARIKYVEARRTIDPYWKPYYDQAAAALSPYLAPAWQAVNQHVITPVHQKILLPIYHYLESVLRR